MMSLSVDIVIKFMVETPATIWGMLNAGNPTQLSGDLECDFGEFRCAAENVSSKIKGLSKPHFLLDVADGKIFYGHLRNFDHSLVTIKRLVSDIEGADEWVTPFLSSDGFIQAWVVDEEYNFWQNADDPIEYTAKGKSYAGLPTRSNGFPYPLKKDVIDTSNNPGRRVIRQGYAECVGAVMWFGDEFMNRTGLSEEVFYLNGWLNAEKVYDRVVRIQVAEEAFTTARGKQGRLQKKIRSLLFPDVVT